jgi:hypothetical protein
MILSVAMDAEVEAARPWVEAASPDFVTLIDRNHLLSSLYNMVNVPQAVWIDEQGRVVRPTETRGSIDILKEFDPAQGGFPEDALARAGAAKQVYNAAVEDWAIHGSASRHVFDAGEARSRVPVMSAKAAEAHAQFLLGQHLHRKGREEEAERCFARCRSLHPASWNIFRQTSEKMEIGIAAGEEFWAKGHGLGDEAYYAPIDMEGLGE